MEIRPVMATDATAIAALYAPHVLHGTATFEIAVPDAADFAARIEKVAKAGAPWLVAHDNDGALVGFAYAAQFRDRAAYRFTCENSVYIAYDRRGEGIGTRLLHRLLAAAEQSGFRQMIAVISGSEPASVALHGKAGFVECGRLASAGRKHATWLDVIYMQRALGGGDTIPPEFEPS